MRVFANPRVTLGPAAPEGSTLTVNAEKDGRIAILKDSSEPMTASAMPTSLIYVEVEVVANADRGPTMIAFTGDLAGCAMSDGLGRSLPTIYTDGVVVIGDPNDRVAIDRSIDLWFMVRPLSSMVGTSLGVF